MPCPVEGAVELLSSRVLGARWVGDGRTRCCRMALSLNRHEAWCGCLGEWLMRLRGVQAKVTCLGRNSVGEATVLGEIYCSWAGIGEICKLERNPRNSRYLAVHAVVASVRYLSNQYLFVAKVVVERVKIPHNNNLARLPRENFSLPRDSLDFQLTYSLSMICCRLQLAGLVSSSEVQASPRNLEQTVGTATVALRWRPMSQWPIPSKPSNN